MTPTPFPGHPAPGAGFELPLAMLSACHHRVEQQCRTLRRLPAHLAQQGVDSQARSAARAVMRYFDTAARDHHADEEVDVFPALIEAMAGSDALCIKALVAGLTADHRQLERLWQALRARLQALADSGGSPDAQASLMPGDVEPFIALYEQHIAREDSELLPMATRLLSDEAMAQIGHAMRRRRGIADTE